MSLRSYELTEALASLIHRQPFYAVLLLDLLEIVETTTIKTAGTDSKSLYVNPEWFKSHCRNVDERVFVLAHEIQHVIRQHPLRTRFYKDLGFGPDMKPFKPGKANKAMDYIINDSLIKDGVGKPPASALINPQYDSTKIWDEVYELLPDEDDDDDPNNGMDEHMSGDPGNAPTKAQIQRAVQSAAAAAKAQGKMPAGMQRVVDEICEPQIPWQEYLRKALTTSLGNDQLTWAKPNRRRLAAPPHVYWPGRVGVRSGVVASVNDTSGSVSDKEQSAFFGELHGILSDLQPELVYVLFVDAEVCGTHELHDVNDLINLKSQVKGGGGTDMTVGLKACEQLDNKPSTVIVFTDGYTPFGEDNGIPTIWCITSDIKAPWGTTVHVKVQR